MASLHRRIAVVQYCDWQLWRRLSAGPVVHPQGSAPLPAEGRFLVGLRGQLRIMAIAEGKRATLVHPRLHREARAAPGAVARGGGPRLHPPRIRLSRGSVTLFASSGCRRSRSRRCGPCCRSRSDRTSASSVPCRLYEGVATLFEHLLGLLQCVGLVQVGDHPQDAVDRHRRTHRPALQWPTANLDEVLAQGQVRQARSRVGAARQRREEFSKAELVQGSGSRGYPPEVDPRGPARERSSRYRQCAITRRTARLRATGR